MCSAAQKASLRLLLYETDALALYLDVVGARQAQGRVGSQLRLGRHPANESVWSLSELFMCCLAPTQGHLLRSSTSGG